MDPEPIIEDPHHKPCDKLKGKTALITGGDSGIGRAVAILFAREGADVAIVYLKEEEEDAERTRHRIEELGRKCLKIPGDLGDPEFCTEVVEETVREFGQLDILVNNAAEQHVGKGIQDVSAGQLEETYRTNFFGYFNLTREAVNISARR